MVNFNANLGKNLRAQQWQFKIASQSGKAEKPDGVENNKYEAGKTDIKPVDITKFASVDKYGNLLLRFKALQLKDVSNPSRINSVRNDLAALKNDVYNTIMEYEIPTPPEDTNDIEAMNAYHKAIEEYNNAVSKLNDLIQQIDAFDMQLEQLDKFLDKTEQPVSPDDFLDKLK